ncbi:hypothetical protein KI614_11170 [Dechloromonas denitrificans]|uniref:hypothetical protein n=1 Tax=Dechloromonas denitrificans TaxID=281362 RepID=UPI001CF8CF99|nr:hypothetical protein [Dechloromonas denitrificans]UCV10741.1 hypothetical protein KI614_11170 [Dechloromonas denitrificans]
MTINQVHFASRELAESLAGNPYMAVISITDPGQADAKLDPMFHHVLRLSFYDAQPADEYLPAPIPGLFDHQMARRIHDFVAELQAAPFEISVMVHCEYGVSRSAAVALFVEAFSGAPLTAREFTYEANQWVLERLSQLIPGLQVDIPPMTAASDRRTRQRAS